MNCLNLGIRSRISIDFNKKIQNLYNIKYGRCLLGLYRHGCYREFIELAYESEVFKPIIEPYLPEWLLRKFEEEKYESLLQKHYLKQKNEVKNCLDELVNYICSSQYDENINLSASQGEMQYVSNNDNNNYTPNYQNHTVYNLNSVPTYNNPYFSNFLAESSIQIDSYLSQNEYFTNLCQELLMKNNQQNFVPSYSPAKLNVPDPVTLVHQDALIYTEIFIKTVSHPFINQTQLPCINSSPLLSSHIFGSQSLSQPFLTFQDLAASCTADTLLEATKHLSLLTITHLPSFDILPTSNWSHPRDRTPKKSRIRGTKSILPNNDRNIIGSFVELGQKDYRPLPDYMYSSLHESSHADATSIKTPSKKSIRSPWIPFLDRLFVIENIDAFFETPSDAQAPSYQEIVKEPMGYRKLRKLINHGTISTGLQIVRAINLIHANALMYNDQDHPIYQLNLKVWTDVQAVLKEFKQLLVSNHLNESTNQLDEG